MQEVGTPKAERHWDHSSRDEFVDYYAQESDSEATRQRFLAIRKQMLRIAEREGLKGPFDVADVGCGAGTQARLWATLGHRVRGLDVNGPLLGIARERALKDGLDIRFDLGSATALPWDDACIDMCLLPELLEHVTDWQSCLREAARVIRPGGLLFVTTTNVLCPIQQEFNLPLYSWYPAPLKRRYEKLAVTTRPEIANHATYPAVHWFSFYQLRDFLAPLGFARCLDRFDLVIDEDKSPRQQAILRAIRRSSVLRFLAQVATPATGIVAVKSRA